MAANGNGKYARLIATVVDNVGGEDNVTLRASGSATSTRW